MFCEYCGKPIPSDARFCEHCGKPVSDVPQPVPQAAPRQEQQPVPADIRPGFSKNINHPSFRAAMNKTERGTGVFAILLILAPIVVAFVLSVKEDNFTYLGIGGAVSVFFLITNLISAAKKKTEKQWDGTVIDKQTRTARKRDLENKDYIHYTEYITVFRDERGKEKKCVEGSHSNDMHPNYDYLRVGDRVRYHPFFGGFYEKYDKSGDTHIYCPACGAWTAITEDICENCGTILLK